MSAKLEVAPQLSQFNLSNTPVRIDILDQDAKPLVQEWVQSGERRSYEVEPGLYTVRIAGASGVQSNQVVRVENNSVEWCSPPLHQVSPHETQQWAYLTQPITSAGSQVLSDSRYKGIWMRLWTHQEHRWQVIPLPLENDLDAKWNQDSVTYRLRMANQELYLIQVGGPKIRWKLIALPRSEEVMVLVRPAPEKTSRHPLDVVTATNDGQSESLLTLLLRGDLINAKRLVTSDSRENSKSIPIFRQFAPPSNDLHLNIVSGYYLLRTADLEKLNEWENRLSSQSDTSDTAIIRAWQHFLSISKRSKAKPSHKDATHINKAEEYLLSAINKGLPAYTEGMRLLRDGLLLLSQWKKENALIAAALIWVGRYMPVLDWSSTSTVFTGDSPDEPREKSRKGIPSDRSTLIYVFDVPTHDILRHAEANKKFRITSTNKPDLESEISIDQHNEIIHSLRTVQTAKYKR